MMDEKDEVRDALHILVEAEMIKDNKPLMEKVIKRAEEEKDAIKSIADLKRKYEEIVQPKEMPKKVGIKKEKDDLDKTDDAAILDKEETKQKGWKDVKEEENDAVE